jgi:hypothetical protein
MQRPSYLMRTVVSALDFLPQLEVDLTPFLQTLGVEELIGLGSFQGELLGS